MKKILSLLALAVMFSSILHVAAPSFAADLEADTILAKMKAAFEPETASTRTLTFFIKDHEKVMRTWVAREARKTLPDGKRTLLVMLKPEELKGLARLVWEREGDMNIQWIYLPAVKRITKIVPVNAYDSFQGTDFTYSDFGFIDIRGTHKLLEEAPWHEQSAYKVETIPVETFYYSRIVTWVSKENFLPLEREFYDVSGKPWKRELFENVTVINNIPTPLLIRMVDEQARTSTAYQVSEVCYGATLPDEIFQPKGLTKALEYDFCPLPEPKQQ